MTARIVCPVHGIPDCSPMLNGCSRVIELHKRASSDALDTLQSRKMLTRYMEAMAKSDGLPTAGTFTTLDYREYAEAVHTLVTDILRGHPLLCGYTWEGNCGPCMLAFQHDEPHVCGCEPGADT